MVQAFKLIQRVQLSLHRMLKDAKKEKGLDDFLGNVVLKLKVYCITLVNAHILIYSYHFLPQTHTIHSFYNVKFTILYYKVQDNSISHIQFHGMCFMYCMCVVGRTCIAQRTHGITWSPGQRHTQTEDSVIFSLNSFIKRWKLCFSCISSPTCCLERKNFVFVWLTCKDHKGIFYCVAST